VIIASLNLVCLVWFGILGYRIQKDLAAREQTSHEIALVEKQQVFYKAAQSLCEQGEALDSDLYS